MQNIADYNDVLWDAWNSYGKQEDLITKKQALLESVFGDNIPETGTVLFSGFTPLLFAMQGYDVYLDNCSPELLAALQEVTPVKKVDLSRRYNVVVASDEFFTFAESEADQIGQINKYCRLAQGGTLLATVRDYKNQDYKEREVSQPAIVRNKDGTRLYVEHLQSDMQNREVMHCRVYSLGADVSQAGPWQRRPLYFKQFAKFCYDSGAKNFTVQKNAMYKSLIKRTYEHIITVKF
jgi:hypothetical protein